MAAIVLFCLALLVCIVLGTNILYALLAGLVIFTLYGQKAGLFVERTREDDLLGREDVGKRAARLSADRHSDGVLACVRHAAVHYLLRR